MLAADDAKLGTMQDLRKEKGWELDARLLGYAWALQHSQDWGIAPS